LTDIARLRTKIGRKVLDHLIFLNPQLSREDIMVELITTYGFYVSPEQISRRQWIHPRRRCFTCWRVQPQHELFRHKFLLPAEVAMLERRIQGGEQA